MKKAIALICLTGIFSLSVMAAEQIRIAVILSKTGIATLDNTSYATIAELAADEINSHGGLLGKPLDLVIIDNNSTPLGSILAAEKAVQLQATAVVGGVWSSHSLAMAPVLQKAGIPMITPASTNPKVTLVGDCIFRVCFTDSVQGNAMAHLAYYELRARTAAVMKIVNEEYSQILAESFSEHFKRYGGKIILKQGYKSKTIDFKDILQKLKKSEPDVVFVPGYSRDSGLLVRQATLMGIHTTFLGGDGWSDPRIYNYGGDALEGAYYSTNWHTGNQFPRSNYLKNIYRRKYKRNIDSSESAMVYDAFMILADAVRLAGSADRAKIRNALAKTEGFQGISGTITFDANGDPVDKDVIIMKMGKKTPVYFKTVKP